MATVYLAKYDTDPIYVRSICFVEEDNTAEIERLTTAGFKQVTEEEYATLRGYFAEQKDVERAPTTDERVTVLEEENALLKAQIQAQSDQMDFYEECIVEMAEIVYA